MPQARPPGGKGSSLREGPEAAVPRAATADSTATGAELGLEPKGYGHTHTHTRTHTHTHTRTRTLVVRLAEKVGCGNLDACYSKCLCHYFSYQETQGLSFRGVPSL